MRIEPEIEIFTNKVSVGIKKIIQRETNKVFGNNVHKLM